MPSSSSQRRRRPRPTGAATAASRRGGTAVAPRAPAGARRSATGLGLRFISCGIISVAIGLGWRLTLAPSQVHIGSALLGIVLLLAGFVLGGVLWYLRDARLRLRNPALVDDERIVFSFVVFVLVPFAVLAVVTMVWLLALAIGASS